MQKTLLLLLIATLPLKAADTPPTLRELLEQALQKNYKTQVAQQKVNISHIEKQQLKDAYLPTAEVSGSYGFMTQNVSIKSDATTIYLEDGAHPLPGLDNGLTTKGNLARATLDLNALLYSGGKIPALKKAVDQKILAQEAAVEKENQQVIEEVIKAYDQLALLDQVKQLLDESQKRLDVHQKTADKALEYGLITKYEHQKLQLAQSQLKHKQVNYEGQRSLLLEQLAMLTGVEKTKLSELHPSLETLETASAPLSVDKRPELIALDHIIQANKFKVEAEKTWWKPKVAVSASAGYLNLFDATIKGKTALPYNLGYNTLHTNSLQLAPDIRIGIGFKWEIFDGFKGKKEIQKAKTETLIAEAEKAEAEELLNLNLLKNRTELTTVQEELALKQTQMLLAKDALDVATKEFKTGLIKSSELIDAENDYLAAALDYQKSLFNQRRTAVGLLKASGSLQIDKL
ncbi:TolC family protein [Leadbetterella byssophila]|uniref:TolC family protein n=1 Tax=Leadbetterella byssophila TaxID=316068 RepID=UPI0039A3683D